MPVPGASDPGAIAELSGFLEFLYAFTSLIYLPYLALLSGGLIMSLVCKGLGGRRRDPLALRLGGEAIRMALPGSWMVWLPVLAVALNLEIGRRLYGPGMFSPAIWIGLLVLLLAGLMMTAGYRLLMHHGRKASHLTTLVGLGGLVLVTVSCFLLFCGAGQLLMPERWPLLATQPMRALSWIAAWRFLAFCGFGLALAGVGVLFRGGGDDANPPPDGYDGYADRTGRSVALLFTLLFPLCLVLELVNLPSASLSGPLFLAYGALVAAAGWVAWRLAAGWSGRRGPPRWRLLGGLLLALLLAVIGDHLARERILIPQTLAEPDDWRTWGEARAAEAPAAEAGEKTSGPGREIFERVCSSCHAFDRKVVGPPLREVLPKYRGDAESLEKFLRNPTKKNPDYPAMPNPGLEEEEIAAVAGYLLRRLEE